MKKIILLLGFLAFSICASAQGITAANGTVVVKQGTVSVTGGTITAISTGTINSITSGSVALAMTSSTTNASGTVTAGAKSIMFETSSDFAGTIDGVTANANMVYPLSAGWNNSLPQIVYTVTSGSLRIRKLQ